MASYSRVPPSIGGMRLVDIRKTMTGSAFQYERLRLNFVPSHYGFSHCDSLQTVVIDGKVNSTRPRVTSVLCYYIVLAANYGVPSPIVSSCTWVTQAVLDLGQFDFD